MNSRRSKQWLGGGLRTLWSTVDVHLEWGIVGVLFEGVFDRFSRGKNPEDASSL